MISFTTHTLANGLRLIVHTDTATPIAAVNIVYDVGARNENPEKTGFAHLFEHLMFGGSKNIPSYDEPLQMAGGENNAYTNNDHTNYYCTLPIENLETALWLESDRMNELAFSEKSLEVQRNVVMEEFKQRYLNQPYGDVWLLFRPLSYRVHPYRWATIGRELSHIADATMQDVKDFFYRWYRPNNAVMCIAGNISPEKAIQLTEKWFGDIPSGAEQPFTIPAEPIQTERRFLEVERPVPDSMLMMGFPICGKTDDNIFAWDLISDVLGRGNSSRLYKALVKEQQVFTSVSCFVTGDHHPGQLIVSGKVSKGVSLQQAEQKVWEVLNTLAAHPLSDTELQKVKSKAETELVFAQTNVLSKATALCLSELYGTANDVNLLSQKLNAVSANQMQTLLQQHLLPERASVLYYKAK